MVDRTEGWEAIADRFMEARSNTGAQFVLDWARSHVPQGGRIVDVGCGSGVPIAVALVGAGYDIWGIDPAPTLVAAFKRNLPGSEVACETAQDSRCFDRQFNAVIAIGLLFLLSEQNQRQALSRMADALGPDGQMLFNAPFQRCEWTDMLTRRPSRSLGRDAYAEILREHGIVCASAGTDSGGNHYISACRRLP